MKDNMLSKIFSEDLSDLLHDPRGYIRKNLFHPPRPLLKYPRDVSEYVTPRCEEIFKKTSIPCIGIEVNDPRYVFVYFHGNGENLEKFAPFLQFLSDNTESTVYAPEYIGYYATDGKKQEQPHEDRCFDTAARFVAAVNEMTTRPVVFFGYSMGCALALHAAEVNRIPKGQKASNVDFPFAIVLLAPFVSAASVVLARTTNSLYFSGMYACVDIFTLKHAALVQGHPMFVASGGADSVVPPAHSAVIAKQAAKHGVCLHVEIPEADHISLRQFVNVYEKLNDFLQQCEDVSVLQLNSLPSEPVSVRPHLGEIPVNTTADFKDINSNTEILHVVA